MSNQPKFAYFGGAPIGEPILETLIAAGLAPSLVVCNPDRPVGRQQVLTPPPIKTLAEQHNIPIFQPTSYKDTTTLAPLTDTAWDVLVVVAYNFILPGWLLELPTHGVVNVHPSLLPKLRGASPIRSAILRDEREAIGVSIMLMDEAMDHGPILAQEALTITDAEWPIAGPELDRRLAALGGTLLATTLPCFLRGDITPQEQEHAAASYCSKFTAAERALKLNPLALPNGTSAHDAFLRIQALRGIGDTFFEHNGVRVKINEAELASGQLRLVTVTPAGKKPMPFTQYLQSIS